MKQKYYELPNVGDYRKSFYGKAQVLEDENGKHLLSYGYDICDIDENGSVKINTNIYQWDSNTSLRHLKSFLRLFDREIGDGSKKAIMKLYC